MIDGKKVQLPSGAELVIGVSDFEVAKDLYQAVLDEIKHLQLDPNAEIDSNLYKNLFCAGFSSKKIEACIYKCFEKCLYGGARITKATFEPVQAREDYMSICFEVVQENITPFMKNLYVKYQDILAQIQKNVQA